MITRTEIHYWAALLSLTIIACFGVAVTHGASKALPRGTRSAPSSRVTPELHSELLSVRESVWRAWFANDQKALTKLLPPDLIAINNGQSEWDSREKTLASAKEFAAQGGRLLSLNFPRTEMQIYGSVAILYSEFELETSASGNTQKQVGRATEIFVRENGQWVNSGWHLDSGK
ncbi:MAG: nuclear transport factor 2 family protein [Candidatus Acidiferrales bacterium]